MAHISHIYFAKLQLGLGSRVRVRPPVKVESTDDLLSHFDKGAAVGPSRFRCGLAIAGAALSGRLLVLVLVLVLVLGGSP